MALTPLPPLPDSLADWSAPAFDAGRPAKNLDDRNLDAKSLDARNSDERGLQRLRALHGEAGRNLALAQFLERAPSACVILMLAGILALAWAGSQGGASLKPSFAWSVLVLLGVVAMIRLHIKGFARSLRRTPLVEAASDLRQLLLYTGAVWGGGAFLVMPDLPAPALVFSFAILPSLGVALTLRDAKGFAAFALPAAFLTAGAALLGVWPLAEWVAGAIAASCVAPGLVFLLRKLRLRQMLLRTPAHS